MIDTVTATTTHAESVKQHRGSISQQREGKDKDPLINAGAYDLDVKYGRIEWKFFLSFNRYQRLMGVRSDRIG